MVTYIASQRGTLDVTLTQAPVTPTYLASERGVLNVTLTAPPQTINYGPSERGTLDVVLQAPRRYLFWHFVSGVRRPLACRFSTIALSAGAMALGTTSYAIPGSGPVMYVDPVNGNNSNSGSISGPKQSVISASQAIKALGTAEQPATVVLREGTYHEGGYVPGDGYFLRWQAYPGEVVQFDGSTAVTSWTNNGNGTWTASYSAPAIPSPGNDKIGDDPNALLPDMLFYDGVELYQTADNATPTTGQFSVNRSNNTITIADTPSGHEVRVSDIAFLTQNGSHLDILGVGIRRYRCVSNTLHTALYFDGTSGDSVIENCVFSQLGRNALYVGEDNTRISRCTFERIGQTAILGGDLDDLIIERTRITQTDTGKWKTQPTSGAIKLTVARRPVLRYNHLTYSHNGNQIWLDVSCTQCDIYGNFVDGTSIDGTTYADSGICYEECDGGFWGGVQYMSRIVGNTVLNCHKAIVVCASGYVYVSNNTVSSKWTARSEQAILILQDRDVSHGLSGKVPLINCPWWNEGIVVTNNYFLPQAGGWQLLAYDSQGEVPRARAVANGYGAPSTGQQVGGAMLLRVAGNQFAPATGSSSSGSIMATIGQANGNRTNLNTPAALATANATYGLGSGNIGANIQSATPPTTTVQHNNAEPIPSDYAALIGLSAGSRYIGNPLPTPTLED